MTTVFVLILLFAVGLAVYQGATSPKGHAAPTPQPKPVEGPKTAGHVESEPVGSTLDAAGASAGSPAPSDSPGPSGQTSPSSPFLQEGAAVTAVHYDASPLPTSVPVEHGEPAPPASADALDTNQGAEADQVHPDAVWLLRFPSVPLPGMPQLPQVGPMGMKAVNSAQDGVVFLAVANGDSCEPIGLRARIRGERAGRVLLSVEQRVRLADVRLVGNEGWKGVVKPLTEAHDGSLDMEKLRALALAKVQISDNIRPLVQSAPSLWVPDVIASLSVSRDVQLSVLRACDARERYEIIERELQTMTFFAAP